MLCPWKIDRRSSLTIKGEFTDTFCKCLGYNCPCYEEEIDGSKWCYREQRRFPLNKRARGEKE